MLATKRESFWSWTWPFFVSIHLHRPWLRSWAGRRLKHELMISRPRLVASQTQTLKIVNPSFKQLPPTLHGAFQDLSDARMQPGKLCIHQQVPLCSDLASRQIPWSVTSPRFPTDGPVIKSSQTSLSLALTLKNISH